MPACTWYGCLVEFSDHNLNGFTPNLTSRIGCKSIEIMTTKFDQAYKVISMNFYPDRPAMDLHPIQLVKFDWALITGQIG